MHRILHLIDTRGGGGAERVFVQVARGLDPARFESFAATGGVGWVSEALERAGLEPIFVSSTRSADLRFLRDLVGILRRNRIALVHAHLLDTSLYGGLAGLLAGGVPLVTTFHGRGDVQGSHARIKTAFVRWRARAITCVSEALRDELVGLGAIPERRSRVIANGTDTEHFAAGPDAGWRARLGFPADAILVGTIGRFDHVKGLHVLIEAARLARAREPRLQFVFVGTQEQRSARVQELGALRDSLGLADHVRFLPFADDVADAYRGLDIFVLPSLSEGFSLATVEAMATSLPVVATRSGGPEAILSDGRDGLLVSPGDAQAIASALLRLAADPALRARLGSEARRTATRRFGVKAMIRQYERLYLECLGVAESGDR